MWVWDAWKAVGSITKVPRQRRLRLEELREEVVEQERGATDGDAARCARGHALAGPRASSRW